MSTFIPLSITISSGDYLKYSCTRAKNVPSFERLSTVMSVALEWDSRDFGKFEINDGSSSFEEIFYVKFHIQFIVIY